MKKFKLCRPLAAAAVLAALCTGPVCAMEKQNAVVDEALTGDTVRLKGGKMLRYIGVQAPPVQSKIVLLRQYGEASLAFNKELMDGKTVSVEWGSRIRDDQGVLLGYVFLEDGRFANLEVLKNGHGRAVNSVPNLKYSAELRKADLSARRARSGIWKEEPDNPYIRSDYIGEKNTKIYYFPTSPELDRIPQANLVHFHSRVQAKAAGYRACATCKEGDESWES